MTAAPPGTRWCRCPRRGAYRPQHEARKRPEIRGHRIVADDPRHVEDQDGLPGRPVGRRHGIHRERDRLVTEPLPGLGRAVALVDGRFDCVVEPSPEIDEQRQAREAEHTQVKHLPAAHRLGELVADHLVNLVLPALPVGWAGLALAGELA